MRQFVGELAPGIGADVLECTTVPDPGCHFTLHVVVPEGHVTPPPACQLLPVEQGAAVLDRSAVGREQALDLPVEHQHLMRLGALGSEGRTLRLKQRHVRDRQHAESEPGIGKPAGFVGRDVGTESLEQAEDGPGLGGAGSVVVASDDHQRDVRKCLSQPVKLVEREEDRVIGGPDRMEQIPRDDHRVRPGLDDLVHGPTEGVGDVRLPLIEPVGCLAVVLAESEMQVSEMGDLHRGYSKARGVARKGPSGSPRPLAALPFTAPPVRIPHLP